MNRISLSLRLTRLSENQPSDPAANEGVLEAIVDMPMRDYLKIFGTEGVEKLAETMKYGGQVDELGDMTYGQLAEWIRDRWMRLEGREDVMEVIRILVLPFWVEHKRRNQDEANKP